MQLTSFFMGSPSFPDTFVVSHHYLGEVLELFLFFWNKVELSVIFVYSSTSHLEKQNLVDFLTLNLGKKKRKVSLCSTGRPGTHMYSILALNLWQSFCLSFLGAVITGLNHYHYIWLSACILLFTDMTSTMRMKRLRQESIGEISWNPGIYYQYVLILNRETEQRTWKWTCNKPDHARR